MLHSLQGFDFVVVVCVVSTKSLFAAAGFCTWWFVIVRVLFENSIVCQCTFVCGLVACLVVLAVPFLVWLVCAGGIACEPLVTGGVLLVTGA